MPVDFSDLARKMAPDLAAWFPRWDITRDLGRGTANPTSGPGGALAAGDRFFRSDLGFAIYYDGAHWLTREYESDLTPYLAGATARLTVTTGTVLIQPIRTDFSLDVTRIKLYCDVATTNNGTNYWTINIGTDTTAIWAPTTAADAAGAGINKETAPSTIYTGNFFKVGVTKTAGAPGGITLNVSIWYRLVIT
jgi:hypothetical protein